MTMMTSSSSSRVASGSDVTFARFFDGTGDPEAILDRERVVGDDDDPGGLRRSTVEIAFAFGFASVVFVSGRFPLPSRFASHLWTWAQSTANAARRGHRARPSFGATPTSDATFSPPPPSSRSRPLRARRVGVRSLFTFVIFVVRENHDVVHESVFPGERLRAEPSLGGSRGGGARVGGALLLVAPAEALPSGRAHHRVLLGAFSRRLHRGGLGVAGFYPPHPPRCPSRVPLASNPAPVPPTPRAMRSSHSCVISSRSAKNCLLCGPMSLWQSSWSMTRTTCS